MIKQFNDDMIKMLNNNFVYQHQVDGNGNVIWSNMNETICLFSSVCYQISAFIADSIIDKIPDTEKQKRIPYYQMEIKRYEACLQNGVGNRTILKKNIHSFHTLIHEIDPSHIVPEEPQPQLNSVQKGLQSIENKLPGCYVATCVYGSYDCPQVWTLRRYRDDTLGATWYGRAFVHTYYAISPTLVKWFGKTKWFKRMWQGKLDRMVKNLNDKGVENTPYQDKQW